MTADDLVAGLLSAIEQRERLAQAAFDGSHSEGHDKGRWEQSDSGNVYHRNTNSYVAVGPWSGDVESAAGAHMEANDPRSVLRLCRAHRKTIERYQRAASFVAEPGTVHESVQQAVLLAFEDVLRDLAEGFGLSEEDKE